MSTETTNIPDDFIKLVKEALTMDCDGDGVIILSGDNQNHRELINRFDKWYPKKQSTNAE